MVTGVKSPTQLLAAFLLSAAVLGAIVTTLFATASSAAAATAFGGRGALNLPNITNPRAAAVDEFNRWFWRLSPRVNWRLATLPSNHGNGVFVTNESSFPEARAIVKGMTVIEVPEALTICESSIRSKAYGPILSPKTGISEENRIALAVLIEFLSGNASKLQRWMRVLPSAEALVPPHRWTAEELAFVEPRSMRRSAQQRAENLRSEFSLLRQHPEKPLERIHRHLVSAAAATKEAAGTRGPGPTKIDLQLFLWARSLIDTRAWNMGGKKYFVPFADMFNHHPDGEESRFDFKKMPHVHFRSQKFLDHHKISTRPRAHLLTDERVAQLHSEGREKDAAGQVRVLQVLSDRDAAPGEQLYESYGDNSNDIYFNYHGFVPSTGNRYDCQEVAFPPKHELSATQLEVLREIRGMPRTICVHYGELPPGALIAALVAVLDADHLDTECMHAAVRRADARQRPFQTLTRLHAAMSKCARESEAARVMPAFTTIQLDQYRVLKEMIMRTYKSEFNTSKTTPDEQLLAEHEASFIMGNGASSPRGPNPARVATALRLRIGRKKILNRLVATVNAKIAALKDALRDERQQRRHDESSGRAAGDARARGDFDDEL